MNELKLELELLLAKCKCNALTGLCVCVCVETNGMLTPSIMNAKILGNYFSCYVKLLLFTMSFLFHILKNIVRFNWAERSELNR